MLRWQITNTCLIQPGLRPRRAPFVGPLHDPTPSDSTLACTVQEAVAAFRAWRPRTAIGTRRWRAPRLHWMLCVPLRPLVLHLACLRASSSCERVSLCCSRIVLYRIAVAVQDVTDGSAEPAAAADVDDSQNHGGRDEDWHFLERLATPHECACWLLWQRSIRVCVKFSYRLSSLYISLAPFTT